MASHARLAAALKPVLAFASALALALPALAQGKPDPGPLVFPNPGTRPDVRVDGPEALTCAALFNWIERRGPELTVQQANRLAEMLSTITTPGVYAVPPPADCDQVMLRMAREGFSVGDMTLLPVAGVSADCATLVPLVQSRLPGLEPEQQLNLRRVMARVHMPQQGATNDVMACAIVHGALERLNLIDQMR
ncbi:hypothetical protein [Pararhodobacter zhoushanensis]|uniref:Secreted protein n=1 Tax=Pararhodobacter zhoushanensis TaxID=2479545 RepID=A0ABT3H0Z9_9RHOB|nr:hypothetical protein [Pararhodobacter zhoushanensis]MCW1933456.1 hypothetical protein [Pararhodobacter zhoushanensis]